MSLDSLFKAELWRVLEHHVKERYKGIWVDRDIYFGEFHIIFDLFLENDGMTVIELELRRANPVHNVVKTLLWIANAAPQKRVTMIQVFQENHYKGSNKMAMAAAIYVGQKSGLLLGNNAGFSYHWSEFTSPSALYKGHSTQRREINNMAYQIYTKIRSVI